MDIKNRIKFACLNELLRQKTLANVAQELFEVACLCAEPCPEVPKEYQINTFEKADLLLLTENNKILTNYCLLMEGVLNENFEVDSAA